MRLIPTPALPLFLLSVIPSLCLHARFTDVAREAGLYQDPAPLPESNYPAGVDPFVTGVPVCAVDIDRDGWTDLILSPTPGRILVFINNRDGSFREEGVERGFGELQDISGIAAGDLSNRGVPDVVLVPRIGPSYFLMVNDGTGHFTNLAAERGADLTVEGEMHKGQSVALVDYDRDGYLDIHVTEWGVPGIPNNDQYAVLLRNRGREAPGHFLNVTRTAGLVQPHFGNGIYTFASVWADFDEDGYPDLSLISDYGTSQMWWNNGDGTFTEGRMAARVGTDGNGMGVAVADVDRDGRLDFFVSSFDQLPGGVLVSANRLYRNLGERRFENIAPTMGGVDSSWGWGAVFFDPNQDGLLDLLVTNGYPYGHNPDKPRPQHYISDSRSDQTRFYQNTGSGLFESANLWGVTDRGFGRSVAVIDYDNDGFEDVIIGNLQAVGYPYRPWILYRNDSPREGANWLRFRFEGRQSNRDGYGTRVRVTTGSITQTGLYAPTNAYIGQREPVLHFGLGASRQADRVEVLWPSGATQILNQIPSNQVVQLVEPHETPNRLPVFLETSLSGAFEKDSPLTLTVQAVGEPAPLYTWLKDGIPLSQVAGPTLKIKRLLPADAGVYSVVASNAAGESTSEPIVVEVVAEMDRHSVARWWMETLLDCIRLDSPNPPVHARNLYHLSAAMWDAYWAFEPEGSSQAKKVFHTERPGVEGIGLDRDASRRQAISHAAFRVLSARFANSPGASRSIPGIEWLMQSLGYDPQFTGTGGNSPAAVGNRIGYAVLDATRDDGANETGGYRDITGYAAVNEPLVVGLPGTNIVDPNRWQPLSLAYSVTQNGIVEASGLQEFIGVNARMTTPFALVKTSPSTIWIDPGPPPLLGGAGHSRLVDEVVEVIALSAMLDPEDDVVLDISPGAILNNTVGTNDGTGHPRNPVTSEAYAPNPVLRADFARILAEYWADGPDSETPPGHWNVIFNEVSDHPLATHRYRGKGEPWDRLRWDIQGYLALNGALHDAACAAWTLKHQYDSSRPVTLIRYMGGLGQSSNPSGPAYHPLGLPLIPDLIELTSEESVALGGRHASIVVRRDAAPSYINRIVVRSWLGNASNAPHLVGGVGWVLSELWMPYQRNNFVTPAFPGYVSGHSTFSRSAAEVMSWFTGSPFFPGGISSKTFTKDSYLHFERGPEETTTLQWATFHDASDQSGLSRLYGGIHIATDDLVGRRIGARIGLDAFLKVNAMTPNQR